MTGYVEGNFVLPTYSSMATTIDNSITNNTDIDNVIETWAAEATNIGRSSTEHRIIISGASTFDVTIDNNFEEVEEQQDIIKKISVTLTYNIGNKSYTSSMERYKIKE